MPNWGKQISERKLQVLKLVSTFGIAACQNIFMLDQNLMILEHKHSIEILLQL